MRKLIVAALIVCVLGFVSCVKYTGDQPGISEDAKELLQKVELYQSSIKSVKGLARVKIKTKYDKLTYSQVTIATLPDMVRLEALNPFGKTMGLIASDGSKIYIFSGNEELVYDGGQPFYLSYVYPGLDLLLTPEDLVGLLIARLPKNGVISDNVSTEVTDGGTIKLIFKTDSGEDQTVWVNPVNYRVMKADVELWDGKRAQYRFSELKDIGNGLYFPKNIDFSTRDLSITIRYDEDVEVNTKVDRFLFKPRPDYVYSGN